jgi:hypothetical protein
MHPQAQAASDTFNRLKTEIGEWSRRNFGEQESKWLEIKIPDRILKVNVEPSYRHIPLILGATAPALGFIEEYFELKQAVKALPENNTEVDISEVRDAIGDMLIYLADFIHRGSLPDTVIRWECINTYGSDQTSHGMGLNQFDFAIQSFTHLILKRHQGIREGANHEHWLGLMGGCLECVFVALCAIAYKHLGSPNPAESLTVVIGCMETTWETVKKRDWTKNKDSGVA